VRNGPCNVRYQAFDNGRQVDMPDVNGGVVRTVKRNAGGI